jgi:hypothetical protein
MHMKNVAQRLISPLLIAAALGGCTTYASAPYSYAQSSAQINIDNDGYGQRDGYYRGNYRDDYRGDRREYRGNGYGGNGGVGIGVNSPGVGVGIGGLR